MKTLFPFHTAFAVCVILSFMAACKEDPPPTAPVQPSSLRIIVADSLQNIYTPVIFGAEYSGSPLITPEYLWDFGDGTNDVIQTTDTVSHVFISEGSFTVTVHLSDAGRGIALDAQRNVEIINTNPVWYEWKNLKVTIRATFCGIAKDYSGHEFPIVRTYMDIGDYHSRDRWQWYDNSTDMDTAYYNPPCNYSKSMHLELSHSADSILSLEFQEGSTCYTGMSWENVSLRFSMKFIPKFGIPSRDTAIYKASGESVTDLITSYYKSTSRSESNPEIFDTIERDPNSWIEIRLTK